MSSDESSFDSSGSAEKGTAKVDKHQAYFATRLQRYQSECMYNCTFRVGSGSHCEVFKCDKVTLACASPVFETMFSEDSRGPDDPILLEEVDPRVFDSSMKFVYGMSTEDFKCVPHAVEVYKFAHHMKIECLTTALDHFLKTAHATERFVIFDLYKTLNVQLGLDVCKKLMEVHTAIPLASDHWLHISADSVEEFLKMDTLDVQEVDLARALVRWGRFQVQSDGHDPEDGEKLRSKIVSGLKLIQFATLTEKEFADICLEGLSLVLTLEERYSIFLAVATKNWKLLPSDLCSSTEIAPRMKPVLEFPVNRYRVITRMKTYENKEEFARELSSFSMKLSNLNKKVDLVGLSVEYLSTDRSFQWEGLSFEVKGRVSGRGNSFRTTFSHKGREYMHVTPKCTLAANSECTLQFKYPLPPVDTAPFNYYTTHVPFSSGFMHSGWLHLRVHDAKLIDVSCIWLLFVSNP